MSAEYDEGRQLVELVGMLSRAMAPERSDGATEGETVLVVVCTVALSSGGQGRGAGGVYCTRVFCEAAPGATEGQTLQALAIAPQAVTTELAESLSAAKDKAAKGKQANQANQTKQAKQ